MNPRILLTFTLLPAAVIAPAALVAAPAELTSSQAAGVSESLRQEARTAINSAMDWLVAQQNPAGHWSNEDFPALTGLPLWALAEGGSHHTAAMARARAYLLACLNPDGTICREPKEKRKGGGLCNYNTAICMVALHALRDPTLTEAIQKARHAVARSQHAGTDIHRGGMGYDEQTGRPYADLSNSYLAYEAMRLTESVEDLRKAGDPRADLDWEAARQFISRIQNLPGANDQPWAQQAAAEDVGGFAYKPDASMAGSATNTDGSVRLRSYGSMTYAGMLSLIYARVDRQDPRVKSALDWAARHWSLEQNPGMGQQGLFYFYNVLAKSLAASGQDLLALPGGRTVNWREDLVKRLLSVKRTDAQSGRNYWLNDEARWMESDPVLVTSYSILALRMALGD